MTKDGAVGRSEAAQEASRRNGARSQGPRTPTGKRISAKNAVKHGLRVRQAVRPDDLPEWVKDIEHHLVTHMVDIGLRRREKLDRLLQVLVLIDRADRQIAAELGRLMVAYQGHGTASQGLAEGSPGREFDGSTLRRLVRYRIRFRAERDMCVRHVISLAAKKR